MEARRALNSEIFVRIKGAEYFGLEIMKIRRSIIWKIPKDEFKDLFDLANSTGELLTLCGLSNKGGNYKTLKNRLVEEGHDITHLQSKGYQKSKSKLVPHYSAALSEVLVENSEYSRFHLKRRLIEEGYLSEICAECGVGNLWNDKPLVLALDHINGISNDNRIDNLRLLCPNCHSQTATFAGRRKKNMKTCLDCGGVIKYSKTGLCRSCSAKKRK